MAVQYKKSLSVLQNIFLWFVQFEDAEVAMPIIITLNDLLEIHSDSSCTALRVSTQHLRPACRVCDSVSYFCVYFAMGYSMLLLLFMC